LFEGDEVFPSYLEENLEEAKTKINDQGLLEFEYFMAVYKTALIWNRIKFQDLKLELVALRREALKLKDT